MCHEYEVSLGDFIYNCVNFKFNRMINRILFSILLISLATNGVMAQNQAEPYSLKYSNEEIFKGGDRQYAEEIIGTNSNSIFILFTEKLTNFAMSKPYLIIRKYDKNTMQFQDEIHLKKILKDRDAKLVYNIEIINEGVLMVLGTGSYSDYTFEGLIFDKNLKLVASNEELLKTNARDNIVSIKVNKALNEVLIIEYPETDSESNKTGRYLRFDLDLKPKGQSELDLSFLLVEKRSTK